MVSTSRTDQAHLILCGSLARQTDSAEATWRCHDLGTHVRRQDAPSDAGKTRLVTAGLRCARRCCGGDFGAVCEGELGVWVFVAFAPPETTASPCSATVAAISSATWVLKPVDARAPTIETERRHA